MQIQVLIRTESEIPVAAQANIKALETCFWQFSGQNHFRIVGIPLPGIAFIGADRSYTQKLWMGLRAKAAYLPGC